MTALTSSPLPAREGPGVGLGTQNRSSKAPPTPTLSLEGRGVAGDTSRLASGSNLKAAGDKFEAVFTGMMLKAMRQAKLADPLFDSKAIDTFSEMQDAQIAKTMAEHAPMGIGKAMTDFLAKAAGTDSAGKAAQPDLNRSGASPPK